MQKEEEEDAPNVVTGTFSLLTQPVDVLFDVGATHSFISVKLVVTLGLIPTRKFLFLSMTLPDEKTVMCEELYEGCPIRIYECEFLIDLYRFELTDFGAILGMDWLAKHQGEINCPIRKITIKEPNGE